MSFTTEAGLTATVATTSTPIYTGFDSILNDKLYGSFGPSFHYSGDNCCTIYEDQDY